MKDILFFDSDPCFESPLEKSHTRFCGNRKLVIVRSGFPDPPEWQESLKRQKFDLILCSFHDNHQDNKFLSWLNHFSPFTPCIAVGFSRDYLIARAAYLAGADGYFHWGNLINLSFEDVIFELSRKPVTKSSINQQWVAVPDYFDIQSAKDTGDCATGESRSTNPEPNQNRELDDQILPSESVMIQMAKAHIQAHYTEHGLTLAAVSREVSLSEKHFSTLFSKACRITFSNYLMKCRMEKAKELLNLPDQKIYQISMQVGYSSVEHFSRYFKKYTGQSPERFRK